MGVGSRRFEPEIGRSTWPVSLPDTLLFVQAEVAVWTRGWFMPQGRSSCADLGQNLFTCDQRQPFLLLVLLFNYFTSQCSLKNVTFDPTMRPDPIHLKLPALRGQAGLPDCGLRTTHRAPWGCECLPSPPIRSQAHSSLKTPIGMS